MFADEYANENRTPNTPHDGFVSPDARAASTIPAKPMSDKSSCQSNVHSNESDTTLHLGHALGGSTLWNASHSAFQKFKSAFKSFKTVSSPPKTPWIPPPPAPTMPQRPTPHVWRAFGSPYESQDATYNDTNKSLGIAHWRSDLLAASLLHGPLPSIMSNDAAPRRAAAKSMKQTKPKSTKQTKKKLTKSNTSTTTRKVMIDMTRTPAQMSDKKSHTLRLGKSKSPPTVDMNSSSSVKIKNKPSPGRGVKKPSIAHTNDGTPSPEKPTTQKRCKRVTASVETRSCFLCKCTSTDHWRRGYDTSTMGETLCDTCGKRESRRLAKGKLLESRKKRTGSPVSTSPASKRAKR